jgi:hypothetical protein
MSAKTRRTERTEARVETVTVEEVQCPVCQQWYAEGDELTVVGVGVDYASTEGVVEADHLTRVCTSCAESLFDVEVRASGGRLAMIRGALIDPITDVSLPTQLIKPLVSAGITLTVVGIVTSVGLNVANDVAAQVEPNDVEQVGAPLGFLDLLPILLLIVVAWAVLRAPRIGGFR